MTKILKSDLTYSLTGGFLLGAAMLLFMQPTGEQGAIKQIVSATVSAAGQLLG